MVRSRTSCRHESRAAGRVVTSPVGRAVGLSLAVVSRFPGRADGALSISSGYESFLVDIRKRIVCEEGDVVDKALERGTAEPCNSIADGPFCRGLPEQAAMPRHRPYTVDSVVPRHLFDRRGLQTAEGTQAARTLHAFLMQYNNPKEVQSRMVVAEGSLDLAQAGLRAGQTEWPKSYSRGLPNGIMATWEGAWQLTHGTVPSVSPAARGGHPSARRQRQSAAVLRLNSVLGTVRLSRPVVVRHLVLSPPAHAEGAIQLEVRGRNRGKEQWRHSYEFDASSGQPIVPFCEIGDLLDVVNPDESETQLGVLLASHRHSAAVQVLDEDRSHRMVDWRNLRTLAGRECLASATSGVRRAVPQGKQPSLWRDLARRLKAVDEITLLSPSGSTGWLLGSFTVSVARPSKMALEPDSESALFKQLPDPVVHVVQVFPGPRAVIVEASRASVLYDADDMLQRGLDIRQPPSERNITGQEALASSSEDKALGRLRFVSYRSVEGIRQLLFALAGDAAGARARLPPHVTSTQLLADASRLLSRLRPEPSDVAKHKHFEAFFSAHMDVLTPADALTVAFAHWSRSPATQAVVQDAFYVGQKWEGAYFCTQGETLLNLDVQDVKLDEGGQQTIMAEMTFQLEDANGKLVQGAYSVSGTMESMGRVLALDPVQGSWKDQPSNFVMVGFHGVVSKAKDGKLIYAGSIPIYGCDNFELVAHTAESAAAAAASEEEGKASSEGGGSSTWLESLPRKALSWFAQGSSKGETETTVVADEGPPSTPSWRTALRSMVLSLEESRRRWRTLLVQLMMASAEKKKKGTATARGGTNLAQKLRDAIEGQSASGGTVLSLEFTTSDGEQYVVRIGQAEDE